MKDIQQKDIKIGNTVCLSDISKTGGLYLAMVIGTDVERNSITITGDDEIFLDKEDVLVVSL